MRARERGKKIVVMARQLIGSYNNTQSAPRCTEIRIDGLLPPIIHAASTYPKKVGQS
jgi:hypothetical protein